MIKIKKNDFYNHLMLHELEVNNVHYPSIRINSSHLYIINGKLFVDDIIEVSFEKMPITFYYKNLYIYTKKIKNMLYMCIKTSNYEYLCSYLKDILLIKVNEL
jgi:hypothetical protein